MLVSSTLRAGLQSGTIMSLADALTQTVIEKPSSAGRYDVMRTLRWGICGLVLHGPYFLAGFSAIDKRLGAATSWKVVAQKTAIAQFVLFPPYLCLLFSLMGALEGHPEIIEKVQRQVPQAFLGGCIYWPIANGINFSLVPGSMRVPYLAVSAGIWNSYLSWSNQRGNQTIDSNRNQTPKIRLITIDLTSTHRLVDILPLPSLFLCDSTRNQHLQLLP